MLLLFLTLFVILIIYHVLVRKPLAVDLKRSFQCNERHAVQTGDGILLPLYRYIPEEKKCNSPLILCHGMAVNGFHLDNGDDLSLPSYLQSKGVDVWMIELRGSGTSTKIPYAGRFNEFTFDDYVARDLPAVISYVKRITGAEKIHWMGHSMGGMVGYGYIARFDDRPFKSITTIASAIDFSSWTSEQKKPFWKLFYGFVSLFPFIPCRKLGRFLFPHLPQIMIRAQWAKEFTKIINLRNLTRKQSLAFFYNALADMSRGLVLQTIRWVITGRMESLDGEIFYTDCLARMTAPLHVVASEGDVSIPIQAILAGYDKCNSIDKKLTVLQPSGKDNTVFAHADMVHSPACYTEVFPCLSQWVLEKDNTIDER